MRVLITGANGQVGQALARTAPAGVVALPVARATVDITDAAAVRACVAAQAPDLVVNAAAFTAVDQSESQREQARAANEIGPRNLAEAVRSSGARLIHLSTDFVFDGKSSTAYKPEDRPAPLGVYGVTKLAGERAVRELLPERSLVLRTAWVYAATGRNFLLTMLRLMREQGSVRVVSDQIGTPTAADSVAHALWAIAARPALAGIYHWTDAGVASWYDFALAIAEDAVEAGLLVRPPEVVPIGTRDYPTPARRPAFSVLDTSSTREALGSTPPHWRASLRRVIAEIPRG